VDCAQGNGFIAEKNFVCHVVLLLFLRRCSPAMKQRKPLTDRNMG